MGVRIFFSIKSFGSSGYKENIAFRVVNGWGVTFVRCPVAVENAACDVLLISSKTPVFI
jgi:hypothetical protein